MSEFLHMGGYAAFVWGAYGLSGLTLIILGLRSNAKAKALAAQVDTMRTRRRERG